jgi:hypothetical protein
MKLISKIILRHSFSHPGSSNFHSQCNGAHLSISSRIVFCFETITVYVPPGNSAINAWLTGRLIRQGAQNSAHLTIWQAMFPWPSLAETAVSRSGIPRLLGYSQALIDHHFVMAARSFGTLRTLPLCALRHREKRCYTVQSAAPEPLFFPGDTLRRPAFS